MRRLIASALGVLVWGLLAVQTKDGTTAAIGVAGAALMAVMFVVAFRDYSQK